MNNRIFRQKSIDRVKSPEQLNDYIHVSNPSVWLVLAAIIVLLVGIICWGIFGRLETKVETVGTCVDGTVTCYVREADMSKINSKAKITIDGKAYEIAFIGNKPVIVKEELREHLIYLGEFDENDKVYEVDLITDLPDGDYKTEIVTESVSPMSFVLN